jgi:hypothetical protein
MILKEVYGRIQRRKTGTDEQFRLISTGIRGRVSISFTNGSKTAGMDVIGFLYVSIGSSAVQLVANISLMTKRLTRRCGSGWDYSLQSTSMMRVLTYSQTSVLERLGS